MKKLYWREYPDKNHIEDCDILTDEEMKGELDLFCRRNDGGDPPIFEPMMMTEAEFEALPF